MHDERGEGVSETGIEETTVSEEEASKLLEEFSDKSTLETLAGLAAELRDAKQKKKDNADEKKNITAEIDDISQTIISCMTTLGMTSADFDGVGRVTVKAETYPSYNKGNEEAVFAVIRELGGGELIRPYMSAATFKKWFKDEALRLSDEGLGQDSLFEKFDGCVKKFDKHTVSLRKK